MQKIRDVSLIEVNSCVILPCEKNDVSAVDWCKISRKTGRIESKDITSKFLSPKLYALMEWNKESSYKIECFFQDFGEGRTLLFFDLTEYVELVRTEQTTADGKVRKITKPYYLADWQESFGPPMRKVIAQTTKDYSGYYIKELSYPKEMVSRMAEWESKNKSNALTEDMEFAHQMSSCKDFLQDKDFGWMMESALRYSLGRDGCSPERIADFIRRYMDQFDETTLFVMKRDIDAALQGGELPCDVIWRSVSDDLSVQLEIARQARNG